MNTADVSETPYEGVSLLRPNNDLPVIPLGYAGVAYFYLDRNGQLQDLSADQHSHLRILGLCAGNDSWLRDRFKKLNPKGDVIGWNYQNAAAWLMQQCSSIGYFDRSAQCRSSGAWRGQEGSLILHCGDVVLIRGRLWPSGFVLDGTAFVKAPPQLRPAETPATATEMAELYEALQTWVWRHDAAPRLFLGWIPAAMVGGALSWRPHIWLTGATATGKSSLERFNADIFGPMLFRAADPTAAGVRQQLIDAARPVAIDEMETSPDNQRASQMVEFARLASTENQGPILRGSPSGKVMAFVPRASFYFSSILHPRLRPQDHARITILDLEELNATPAERAAHRQKLARLKGIGPKVLARVVARWDQFLENLDCYTQALNDMGLSIRVADQLGTMLAMADMLLCDSPATLESVSEFLRTIYIEAFAKGDSGADHEECLQHLAGAPTEVEHAQRRITVGELLTRAKQSGGNDDRRALDSIGLKLVDPAQRAKWRPALGEPAVAIANDHPGLKRIFIGTTWANGVWRQSLRRIPGALPSKKTHNFAGVRTRAVLVSFHLLDVSDEENDE